MERLTYIGHATTLLRLHAATVLTDPLLRPGLGPLRWHGPRPDPEAGRAADVVLISHIHRDHLDLRSLRLIPADTPLVVPRGTGRLFPKLHPGRLREVRPGETISVADLELTALPAIHNGQRDGWGDEIEPLGFLIRAGGACVYFAGDTDLFPEMSELGSVDLALLPVWGWGPFVGAGHLDPERAAQALEMIRPRLSVPIHWGTLYPAGLNRLLPRFLTEPPLEFARLARRYAPDVRVEILAPGSDLSLEGG